MSWSLAQAKDRFSEVVRRARSVGPQTISVRGKEAAVVVSKAEFDRLSAGESPIDFKTFLLNGPSWDGVDLERRDGGHREFEF